MSLRRLLLKACVLLSLFSLSPVFAQNSGVVQILMPKTVYTGDRCELKYVFHSDADLFSDNITGQVTSFMELNAQWPSFDKFSDKCFIQNVELERSGFEYTLTLSFIPWKAGVIDFAAFDLAGLIRYTVDPEKPGTGAVFLIDFEPITVNSISEKLGIDSIQPSSGPAVVPGTVWILAVLAFVFIAVCAVIFLIIIRLPDLLRLTANSRAVFRRKRICKKTVKLLRKLLKSKKSDMEFCQELKDIVTDYLCSRFDKGFNVLTTKEIYIKFREICCDSLTENQEGAAQCFTEVLSRCDYIRFAAGSIDAARQPAEEYEASLKTGERKRLVNLCIDAVEKIRQEEV